MTDGTAADYVIAAGGTGGHIYPGIALAREILARRPGARIVFVGTEKGLETRLIPAAGFPLELVTAEGFAGKPLGSRLRALARVPLGFLEARRRLRRLSPRAVAGVGGYVSVPVVLAARSLGVPTLIHESNAMPGIANRLLSRVATRTAVGLETASARLGRRGILTGTPVRPEFLAIPPLDPGRSTRRLLVFGGSQGSIVLNRAMIEAAPRLRAAGVQVVHQAGEKLAPTTRQAYGTLPAGWRLEPFLPRLWEELDWADLALCRAGALTLAELSAAGRPAILVPFGSSTHGHQLENARAYARAGAAAVIEEEELTGDRLAAVATLLLSDRARLSEMGRRCRELARPEAARRLADLLFEIERRGA